MFPSDLIKNQQAFLLDVAKLIEQANLKGFICTAGELYRPQEMEDIYFKEGKSKTHNSNHTRRLAIDLNIFMPDGTFATLGQIEPLGTFWESLHTLNRWGGNFTTIKDGPHFERNTP
jgi:hypothetical protein